MRFTKYQYEIATAALIDGSTQLEPDGRECTICGDGGHQAWECSRNPLRAMHLVNEVVRTARDLHEQLHVLGGYYNHGPSAGIEALVPPPADPEQSLSFEHFAGATFPVPPAKVRKWRGDRAVETPSGVLETLKDLARSAALDLSAGQMASVGGGLRELRNILDGLVAFPQDKPTEVKVRMANTEGANLAEVALFVADDQGGHIMFGGLCWRPVRS